jgi:hypothetical protein
MKSKLKEATVMKIKDLLTKSHTEVLVTLPVEQKNEDIIFLIELLDENGEKMMFEHLDMIEYKNEMYSLLTPFSEEHEKYEPFDTPADVFVMKQVENGNGEPLLETVKDESVLQAVYDLFKDKHNDEFEFKGGNDND